MEETVFVGIRRESKGAWERRVPLVPDQVRAILDQEGIEVIVEPSETRIFNDDAYVVAGAHLSTDLSPCKVILGVKEIPISHLPPDKTYVYFAHVIKGQDYNMKMLQHLLDSGCHLIDYEKITDEQGRRLIFFGRYAGLAGMLESLWALGQRLQEQGIDTPFVEVKRAHAYLDLGEAKAHCSELGERLKKEGLPSSLQPFVVGVAGYGNVSQGAQEIIDLFPVVERTPDQLLAQDFGDADLARTVFKVVFHEEHLVKPKEGSFALQEYYDHPDRYEGNFTRFLPHLSVLVNSIYWDTPYPRLMTKEDAKRLYANEAKLLVIGDISCDIEGSIEVTVKASTVDNPVFVYHPDSGEISDGVKGKGPVIMSIDNLPCELPADASRTFGTALVDFSPALARADYTVPLAELDLPAELKRALIVYQGKLTPDFEYLAQYLEQ